MASNYFGTHNDIVSADGTSMIGSGASLCS
jgi:hypothetical protein